VAIETAEHPAYDGAGCDEQENQQSPDMETDQKRNRISITDTF